MVWKQYSTDISSLSGLSDGNSSSASGSGGDTRTAGVVSGVSAHRRPDVISKHSFSASAASKRLQAKKSKRLEEMTINKLRFSRLNGLYGREEETKRLVECFERSLAIQQDATENSNSKEYRQLVLISGASGVGKSALARHLENPARKARGFFVEGRFKKANENNDPYSAVVQACAGLCQEIINLQDSPDSSTNLTFDTVSSKIRQELGDDATILISLVPQLASVLGCDLAETIKVEVTVESRNRFHYAFQCFFRAVATFGILVLVVEDIQWADTESLNLLDSLLGDKTNQSLLIICCYQRKQMSQQEETVASTWIGSLDEKATKYGMYLTEISLDNLLIGDTNAIIADLLDTTQEKTFELAKIVQRKTFGNAFFMKQFLESLAEQDLLEFHFGLMQWTWNEDDIETATQATENVVDLINAKMRSLPEKLRQLLPLAACLGSTFSVDLLFPVVEAFDEEKSSGVADRKEEEKSQDGVSLSSWIQVAMAKGIIEPVAADSHRFLHDRIQEAALGLIPHQDLSQTRYRVGQILAGLGVSSNNHTRADIFVVVNLLNEGYRDGLLPEAKHVETSRLNLEAGKQSIKTASFLQAAKYFQTGIDLLPKDQWSTLYSLSLDLYSSAAEVEHCIGAVEQLEEHCQAVISQDCPYDDKFRAYLCLINSYGHRGLAEKAIDLTLGVLSKLGCRIPKRAHSLHTLVGLIGAKGAVKRLAPENISQLAKMTDSRKINSMILLDHLCTLAYFCKKEYIPLAILKSLRWTLRYGLSECSPPVFATVGILLGLMGDFQGGSIYAQYAMSMLDHHNFRQVEARTIFCSYAMVLHWTLPVHFIMKHLLRGYEVGMKTGDVEHAIYSIMSYIEFGIYAGRSLVSTIEDYEFYFELIRDHKADNSELTRCIRYILLSLSENSETPPEEKVDLAERERVIAETLENGEPIMQASVRRFQLQRASIWGDYEFGAELALEYGEEFPAQVPGHNGVVMVRLHAASCCFAMARKTGKKKYLKCAMKNRAIVTSWVRNGNPNVAHYLHFFDAELAIIRKRPYEAKMAYEAGILLAARNGFVHDQALFNERFGKYVLELNDTIEGRYRIIEALKLYDEWGASGKVEQLLKEHIGLVEQERSQMPPEINLPAARAQSEDL